ncbi:MAG: hypothetical protein ACO1SV_13930 [Fimbriimonas sp.]
MSTGRRAYDILRGYVNHEWERIQGVQMSDAERELYESLEPGAMATSEKATETASAPASYSGTLDPSKAREILGVGPEASFADIRASFDRITKRSDPANFPPGSAEAKQAEEIHRRVHRAYAILTEGMDSTEKRFRSLEID